jgi:hypothetical protein
MAGVQLIVLALRFFRCIASDQLELRGTARLLSTVLARPVLTRAALVALGAILLPLVAASPAPLASFALPLTEPARTVDLLALLLAVAGEVLGRYLFFVSVVPRHLAAPYFAAASEAT